jgi:hypothetical protein
MRKPGPAQGMSMEYSHLIAVLLFLIFCFIIQMAMQAVAFQAVLTRIGFNQQSIAALNANGVLSIQDLINLLDKDTAQILKIIRMGTPPVLVPYLAQKRLHIFCYWATRRNHLNEALTPALFDQDAINMYGTMMALSTQEKELFVKPPGEFKKDTEWKNFKEGSIAYLNAVKGKYNIPLAYIIREDENQFQM